MWKTLAIVLAVAATVHAGDTLPPAVSRTVDFEKDVAPIFQASCMQCHSNGKYEADFSIESREKLLEGGGSSPAIVVGKSAESLLIQLVAGIDPERVMPNKGKRLTPEQVGVLRAWVDQGANWPEGFVLHDANKPIPAKLEPRKVQVPPASAELSNPIDRILQPYFEKNKVTPGQIVDDRVYARRVYLDIIGMLPPADQLEAFAADTNPDKRAALVKKLLADEERYATNWLAFWNDLLRNDYKGTGYIDGGRLQITRWLYRALKENTPYDQFVRQLVLGAPGAEGFTKGIVWRGVVNSAQTPPMQAAQNIGQVFMGVNLKCASCHDSFISQWKLSDCYGLAGVFADKPPEMERCSKPLGETAPMKFLYPELGEIDQDAPKAKRIEQLAAIVTNEKNGRLSRTIVNRLWQRLMGRGIIEPVDEMDNPAWSQDVLDFLAWDFAHDQKYDAKKTITMIVLSQAYQLPPQPATDEARKDYIFAGPCVKRMSAEQFVDAVAAVSGVWTGKIDARLSDAAERYAKPQWIWNDKDAAKVVPPGKLYLRKVVENKRDLATLTAIITCDNAFALYINGREAAAGEEWTKPVTVDLKPFVGTGKNVFAVVATNTTNTPGPAGFWMRAEAKYVTPDPTPKGDRPGWNLSSDANWKWSNKPPDGWMTPEFDDTAWPKVVVLGDTAAEPWKLLAMLPDDNPLEHPEEVRASLCAANPLTTALGRPNRDQVNTVRPTAATTLMALELTNGTTLTEMLKAAAKKIATDKDVSCDLVVATVYAKALGRAPTPAEAAAAKEIVGANVAPEGVEDFLWAVVMLPEFQLIR